MTSTRVFFDTLLSNGCRACVVGEVGWWNDGILDWSLSGGIFCGERGAGRVYSFQFSVYSCSVRGSLARYLQVIDNLRTCFL